MPRVIEPWRGREVAESCRLDLERTGSFGPAHMGGPCENSDEEIGLSRRCPVGGGLRLRGATYDGPPPPLPSTR